MKVTYFNEPQEFRDWLVLNHSTADELWVGFHKKKTGKPSMTWSQSVNEALCFGWIDGIRQSVDDERYTIRFTPRRPGSVWSTVNLRKMDVLIREGRMTSSGLKAYEQKRENRSGIYSYENRPHRLPEPYAGILKKNVKARVFFAACTPGYRRRMIWYVISAKREPTRLQRLEKLIASCAAGKLLG